MLAELILDWVDWTDVPTDERADWRRAEIALLAALTNTDHPCVAPGVLTWHDPQWRAFARKVLGREPVEWGDPTDLVPYSADEAAAVRALTDSQPPLALAAELDPEMHPAELSHRVLWATGFGATRLDRPDAAAQLLSAVPNPIPEHLTELDIAANALLGAILCGAPHEQVDLRLERFLDWADQSWPPDWNTDVHPFIVIAIADQLNEGAQL